MGSPRSTLPQLGGDTVGCNITEEFGSPGTEYFHVLTADSMSPRCGSPPSACLDTRAAPGAVFPDSSRRADRSVDIVVSTLRRPRRSQLLLRSADAAAHRPKSTRLGNEKPEPVASARATMIKSTALYESTVAGGDGTRRVEQALRQRSEPFGERRGGFFADAVHPLEFPGGGGPDVLDAAEPPEEAFAGLRADPRDVV